MTKPRSWTCSVCGRHATVGDSDVDSERTDTSTRTSEAAQEGFSLFSELVRCPNPDCHAYHLSVSAYKSRWAFNPHGANKFVADFEAPAGVGSFEFLPATSKPLSATVSAGVQEDYCEAYLIRHLSPKAAATLARRALQGMIRDFWGVSKGTLAQELALIKDRCDADLYQAMMDVKSIGNIGAHPERDIALIIDIEPDEAQQLLDLIHTLDQDWYVARESKKARILGLRTLAAAKAAEK